MLCMLPVEIQEKILGYLTGLDLVSAGRVSQLWYQLADTFCRKTVLAEVPDDVLEELRAELPPAEEELSPAEGELSPVEEEPVGDEPARDAAGEPDGRWLELHRRWLQAQLRGQVPWRVERTHHFPFTVFVVFADGRRLFAADSKGVLTVLELDAREQQPQQEQLYLHDGHIDQMLPVWRLRLLVVTGADTHFIHAGRRPRLLMCSENMTGRRWVSVHRDLLATMQDIYQRTCITIYRLGVDARWAHLQPLCDVTTPGVASQWSLWRQQLICFLRTGELCVWDRATGTWSHHADPYVELRYENPAWLVRDSVLCSTLTQRELMGYWHLDRGLTYWLQGRVDRPLTRAQPANNEVILCLCARRSLIVAGTKSGKVLLFHSGTREQGELSEVSLTSPVCVIELGFNAVESVTLGFSDRTLYVFVKSRKSMVELIELRMSTRRPKAS